MLPTKQQKDELTVLLRQFGIEEPDDLENGGVVFSWREHRIEIYKSNEKWVFAYNEDPPVPSCWEFVEGDLDMVREFLTNPDALCGW